MEILEAYDLTGSFRAAAGLVGCDHKTVAYWVRQRDEAGGMPVVERARPAMEAVFAAKIESWLIARMVRSGRMSRMGSWSRSAIWGLSGRRGGGSLTSKRRWRRKHGRRTRPWIPEPGLWMQWDYGDGPTVEDRRRCCSARGWRGHGSGWWCRCAIRRCPSVVLGLDRALRMFGGVPTYALTDNERTVWLIMCAGSRSATRRSWRSPVITG